MKIEDEIQAKFDDERFKAMINIKFTANWLGQIHHNLLSPFGISLPQFNILRILKGSKGEMLNVSDVRSRMVEKSPNTTRLMDKLIDKKLIERVKCKEDRRIIYVRIIEDGMLLLETIEQNIQNMNDEMNKISAEEAQTINTILDKIRS